MAEHAFVIEPDVDAESFCETLGLGLFLVYEGEEADAFTIYIERDEETDTVWVLVEHEEEDAILAFFQGLTEVKANWASITDRDVTIAHTRWRLSKTIDAPQALA